ncbi:metal ABC transporter permease [Ornithinimicrobium cavernae]|uniref:metal ABC transporter permease n=1 Tax=Ornithinimicrobium cavernae TaxID=2666047 RepID=UPI000D6906D8|nr:metal ABC transporter permease [Ornithinimicrobium cavernae]
MPEILSYDFMRNALLAALLVGAVAPLVGIFLVQRRLSLIGDGLGHVALAGVAVGVLLDNQPIITALIAAVFAGVAIELIRVRGRTSGDIALAVMFYGGIAAGVVIINRVDGSQSSNLTSYLFGAITTTSTGDLIVFGVLSAVIIGVTLALRHRLFLAAGDEEYARASGLPVMALNITLSVLTAVTVVVSMRVVGLLLISALMIVPNAASQQVARSFRSATLWAVLFGMLSAVGGVVTSFYADTAAGGTIVLLAIAIFLLVAAVAALVTVATAHRHRVSERHPHEHGPGCGHEAVPHGDHVDYVHGSHLHAPHGGHYDEHADHATYPGATDPSDQEHVTR